MSFLPKTFQHFISNNRLKAFCLSVFVLLFLATLDRKLYLVHNYFLNIDEIYTLSHVQDFTIDSRSPGYDIETTYPVRAINFYRISSDTQGIQARIANLMTFLKRWHQVDVHPPIATMLIKCMTPGTRNFITLRYWALGMFLTLVVILYLLLREFGFARTESLIGLSLFASSSLGCLASIFPRPYTPAMIFLSIALIFFNKQQQISTKNKTYVFYFLLLSYLTFLTHYIAWLSLIIISGTLSSYYFLRDKNYKTLMLNLSQTMSLGLFYLIHYQQIKTQQGIFAEQYSGHLGWREFRIAYDHLYNMITLNLPHHYAWIIFTLIIAFCFINYRTISKDTSNLELMCFSLAPFIAVIIVDFYTNKNLIPQIRYLLFALPFLSILLVRIFAKQLLIFTLIFAPIVYFSSTDFALQRRITIDYLLKNKYRTQLKELESSHRINKDPVMILVESFDAVSIFFVHSYICKALNVSELDGPDLNDPETAEFLRQVYIIDANTKNIERPIVKHHVRKVINTENRYTIELEPQYKNEVVVI